MKVAFIYHCDDFIKEIEFAVSQNHKVKTFHYTGKVSVLTLPRIILKIKRLMRWADTVFFEWSTFLLAIASRLRKPRKTQIITRLHRFELHAWVHRIKWNFVDRIIFVNKSVKEQFKKLNTGLPLYKMHVIRNYVNVHIWKPIVKTGKPSYNMLMIGRIIPLKRQYDVVLAMKSLIKKYPKMKLFLIGDDSDAYAKMVKNAIHYLGLVDHVKMIGTLTPKVLNVIFAGSDIVICNSIIESFGYTIQEGLINGCEVFSHNWDGVREVLPKNKIFTTQVELIQKINKFYDLSDVQRANLLKLNRELGYNENYILGRDTLKQIGDLLA